MTCCWCAVTDFGDWYTILRSWKRQLARLLKQPAVNSSTSPANAGRPGQHYSPDPAPELRVFVGEAPVSFE